MSGAAGNVDHAPPLCLSWNRDVEARQREAFDVTRNVLQLGALRLRRNLRRAGTLKNRSRTSTVVPARMRVPVAAA